MAKPMPGARAPDLKFPLTSGETFNLSNRAPKAFTLMSFYRGLHCPICKKYVKKLDGLISGLADRGVEAVAVSMDSEERAKRSVDEWGIDDVPVGYDLGRDQALACGLYISSSIKDGEPSHFSEPGMMLVRPDQTLYSLQLQTVPFARPELDSVLSAIDYILDNDYPPRGAEA